jgi:hypothetical protein
VDVGSVICMYDRYIDGRGKEVNDGEEKRMVKIGHT